MFDWLKRKGSRDEMPGYAAIRRTPSRGVPADLRASEAGEVFAARREVIQRALRGRCLQPDEPLFTILVAAGQQGMLTMALPDGSQCLPIFTSAFRSFDYKHVLLANGPPAAYMASTPLQLVSMLGKLREMGIGQCALDRCPRCTVVTLIDSASIRTADDAITCWVISRGGDLARTELYLDYAKAAALAGKRTVARDVALETVAHVSLEDPRVHYLLGQVAVALEDKEMLREARAFLKFLKHESWEQKLDEVARGGAADFEVPDLAP